jgi:hypothetical protein
VEGRLVMKPPRSPGEILSALIEAPVTCRSCGGRVSFYSCIVQPTWKPTRLLCPRCEAPLD